MLNRRKFLMGMAVSPAVVAVASLPKDVAAKTEPKIEIQPLPIVTTMISTITMKVSACDQLQEVCIPDWQLES